MKRAELLELLAVTSPLALLALLAPIAPVPIASAEETWCEVDPPVVLRTPAGKLVVVYLVNGGQPEHAASLLTPDVSYSATPVAGAAATKVVMRVRFTDRRAALLSAAGAGAGGTGSGVISRVWRGPAQTGTLYSERAGTLGGEVQHEFVLQVP